MEEKRKLTRREFLQVSVLATAGVALTACKQPTPPTTEVLPAPTSTSDPDLVAEVKLATEVRETIEKFGGYRSQAIALLAREFPEMTDKFQNVTVRVRLPESDESVLNCASELDQSNVSVIGYGSDNKYNEIKDCKYDHHEMVIDVRKHSPLIQKANEIGFLDEDIYVFLIARELLNCIYAEEVISQDVMQGLIQKASELSQNEKVDKSDRPSWEVLSEYLRQACGVTRGFKIEFQSSYPITEETPELVKIASSLDVLNNAFHTFILLKIMRDSYGTDEEILHKLLQVGRNPVSKGMYIFMLNLLFGCEFYKAGEKKYDEVFIIDLLDYKFVDQDSAYYKVLNLIKSSRIETLADLMNSSEYQDGYGNLAFLIFFLETNSVNITSDI